MYAHFSNLPIPYSLGSRARLVRKADSFTARRNL
jgi:hypothetical protein